MRVNIVSVGSLKEKFWKDAEKEYLKRLQAYTKVSEFTVKDERTSGNLEVSIKKEGVGILSIVEKLQRSFIILLDINGKELSSVEFSEKIEEITSKGFSDITFIIGGSCGVSEDVKNLADFKMSFGKMTYPHQLFKVVFLEQLYRGFKISKNEPYHK